MTFYAKKSSIFRSKILPKLEKLTRKCKILLTRNFNRKVDAFLQTVQFMACKFKKWFIDIYVTLKLNIVKIRFKVRFPILSLI